MNDHTAPLNKETCDQVQDGLYAELQALGVTKVLDRGEFRRARGYTPCCSSIFLVGENPGGSYDYRTQGGVEVVVHNGTLMRAGGKAFGSLSNLYEAAWLGAPRPVQDRAVRRPVCLGRRRHGGPPQGPDGQRRGPGRKR